MSTLDRLVPERDSVSFMKMDLEGGEFAALRGARRILERDKPLIVFEHGGDAIARYNGYQAGDFFDFWSAKGYALFDVFGRPQDRAAFADHQVWCLIAVAEPAGQRLVRNIHVPLVLAAQRYALKQGPLNLEPLPTPAPEQPTAP